MKNNRYYQKCITFGRAAEGLRADFQEQLIELQKGIGFKYVRFHGIFHDDMAVYREENSEPKLWFGYVDKLFDFLLAHGLKPLLELGFVPTELALFRIQCFGGTLTGARQMITISGNLW